MSELKSIGYAPASPPADPKELQRYLQTELAKIAGQLRILGDGRVPVASREPQRPRDGDVKLADGVNWSPDSSGAPGVFAYYSGAWNKLG